MSDKENSKNRMRLLVRGLGIIAAINCVIVPLLFARQQPLFPLPGLYLIEIAVLGIVGLSGLLIARPHSSVWRVAPWIAAGALLAFVILGGFSIGFYLIPATIAFFLGGLFLNRMEKISLAKYFGFLLGAAVLQATVMIILVQIA